MVRAAERAIAGQGAAFDQAGDRALKAAQEAVPKGAFTELPVHPLIFFFHLHLHHHVWVHVDDVEPYRYRPELKTKLVLPPEQTDLVDILTAEMDTLMEDVVAGKSGGTWTRNFDPVTPPRIVFSAA